MSKTKLIKNFVEKKIAFLAGSKNDAYVRSQLASIRRGIGKAPGTLPELWEIFFDQFPEELAGYGQKTSEAERAIYAALTFYAMHQQGRDLRTMSMQIKDQGLGKAVAMMVKSSEDLARIKRRFDAVVTASSREELLRHLQGLIKQLKTDGIGLDYGQLASDIYLFTIPAVRDEIKLQWGRDFYRQLNSKQSQED